MLEEKIKETGLRYGLSYSTFLLIYYLLVFFVSDNAFQLVGEPNLLMLVLVVVLAHRQHRSEHGSLSYLESFYIGLYCTVIGALISALVSYVYLTQVNNALIPFLLDEGGKVLDSMGFDDDELQPMMRAMRQFLTPGTLTFSRFFSTLVWGSLLSLLIGLFTKKKTRNDGSPEA
ncbi:MAG: DUF4199 domain-containing protein [Cytophagales bacterium]|nr:DUF4199 domain-containing protein [Cytophagales bacterium]